MVLCAELCGEPSFILFIYSCHPRGRLAMLHFIACLLSLIMESQLLPSRFMHTSWLTWLKVGMFFDIFDKAIMNVPIAELVIHISIILKKQNGGIPPFKFTSF